MFDVPDAESVTAPPSSAVPDIEANEDEGDNSMDSSGQLSRNESRDENYSKLSRITSSLDSYQEKLSGNTDPSQGQLYSFPEQKVFQPTDRGESPPRLLDSFEENGWQDNVIARGNAQRINPRQSMLQNFRIKRRAELPVEDDDGFRKNLHPLKEVVTVEFPSVISNLPTPPLSRRHVDRRVSFDDEIINDTGKMKDAKEVRVDCTPYHFQRPGSRKSLLIQNIKDEIQLSSSAMYDLGDLSKSTLQASTETPPTNHRMRKSITTQFSRRSGSGDFSKATSKHTMDVIPAAVKNYLCGFKYFNKDDPIVRFYMTFLAVPVSLSILYASALLLPPGFRDKAPFLLWTDGALARNKEGIISLCPRESICSEGILQICLIGIARLSAFATYTLMAQTFLTKMHCTIHALSTSFVGTMVPFSGLHHVHPKMGFWYAILATVHTVTHIARWILRNEMRLTGSQAGITGIIGFASIVGTVWSMSAGKLGAKSMKKMMFEDRLAIHYWLMMLLCVALIFHTRRSRVFTAIFGGLWLLDHIYGIVFKTYRLDLVEFSPLPNESGVQMLWRNPPSFNANSGEYVKVQLPWLQEGGDEWHPFSLYLQEATSAGLDEVLKIQDDPKGPKNQFPSRTSKLAPRPSTTAILLIEFQNEYASKSGKLHANVKDVLESTQMLSKTLELANFARSRGVRIIHIPILYDDKNELENPNKNLGVLKNCLNGKYFLRGSWNAEIVDSHRPKIDDIVIYGKHGLDCFVGTNLQNKLDALGITTIILGGFLTNCCVESTMRTGYEKGFNVITLIDGTACTSQEEQLASTEYTYKMFSTPMTCAETMKVIEGKIPDRLFLEYKERFGSLKGDDEEQGLDSLVYTDLEHFISHTFKSTDIKVDSVLISGEAREQIRSQSSTTQIFMVPAGDWTKEVYNEVSFRTQLRSCWVRGPYVSPYSVASNFSNLVLLATGIGITPALGVIGQYKGLSRLKTLVWSTRSLRMLEFFVPLLDDCHLSIIYYTGTENISNAKARRLTSSGKLFLKQSRPESLTATVTTLITSTESLLTGSNYRRIEQIPHKSRKLWCMFYCGGSKRIRDEFRDFSTEKNIKFEHELFDW